MIKFIMKYKSSTKTKYVIVIFYMYEMHTYLICSLLAIQGTLKLQEDMENLPFQNLPTVGPS